MYVLWGKRTFNEATDNCIHRGGASDEFGHAGRADARERERGARPTTVRDLHGRRPADRQATAGTGYRPSGLSGPDPCALSQDGGRQRHHHRQRPGRSRGRWRCCRADVFSSPKSRAASASSTRTARRSTPSPRTCRRFISADRRASSTWRWTGTIATQPQNLLRLHAQRRCGHLRAWRSTAPFSMKTRARCRMCTPSFRAVPVTNRAVQPDRRAHRHRSEGRQPVRRDWRPLHRRSDSAAGAATRQLPGQGDPHHAGRESRRPAIRRWACRKSGRWAIGRRRV